MKTYSLKEAADEVGEHLVALSEKIRRGKGPKAFKTASNKYVIREDDLNAYKAARAKLTPACAQMLECIKKRSVRDHIETDLRETFETEQDYKDATAFAENAK